MIQYRYANTSELEQYLSFLDRNQLFFSEYEKYKGPATWTEENVKMMMCLDHERFLSGEGVRLNAYSGDLIVGSGSMVGMDKGIAIIGILVDRLFVRQGIATKIITQLEALARIYKCNRCQMHVQKKNKKSIELAQSLDFLPKERHDDVWIFEKRIK